MWTLLIPGKGSTHCGEGRDAFFKHFGHKTMCMCYRVKHVGLHGGSWGDALTYTSHGRRMKEDDVRHTKLIWKILCHQKSFPINVERHPLMLLPCKKLRIPNKTTQVIELFYASLRKLQLYNLASVLTAL